MSGLVLGIDPDAFGALALMDPSTGQLVEVFDMPSLEMKPARLVDLAQVAAILDEWSGKIGDVYIERAWARPSDPPSFAFRVGHNYGGLCGVVRAHFLRLHLPSPQGWKRAMGATSEKDASRSLASDLFPADCARWRFKKHHGRAEAALIAAYGARELRRVAA